MSGSRLVLLLGALLPLVPASSAEAQALHVDPSVQDCSIVFHSSLTQADFRTFVAEGGEIASFRTFSSAEPLGRGRVYGGIMYFHANIDERKPAWHDTFVHPHDTHYLGDLSGPVPYAGVGLTDALDVGAYFTTNPMANYGFLGGSVRYALLTESARTPAASVIANYGTVIRVDDVRFPMGGIDLVASKRLGFFAPYLGARALLYHAEETSPAVDLETVNVLGAQGVAGVRYRYSFLNVAGEAVVGRISTWSVKVGVQP